MLLKTNFSIATPEDIPQIEDLVNRSYRGDSSRKGWTSEAHLLDGIRTDKEALLKMMTSPDAVILKYQKHDKLAGCVFLQKQGSDMYLGMLTVDPALQAGGIGKELLKTAEDYARLKQCTSIKMTVISVRTELIQWYEKKGYFSTGERHPFPDDPRFGIPKQQLEFLVLKKNL